MTSFTLYQNGVAVRNLDGSVTTIYFNKDSGKPFYRLKVDTLWDTKHPGIYIGHDFNKTHYFMHNHYQAGKPAIVTMSQFTLGHAIFPYQTEITNTWLKVIEHGLNEVLRGEAYHSTGYNCQTFVNRACNNTDQSEDLNKWIGRGLVGAVVFLGVRALMNRNY
jgi:hypothetical protein